VNAGELWLPPVGAEPRVRRMQAKLHLWAAGDPGRRFGDLFNLIYHPGFLAVAWMQGAGTRAPARLEWTGSSRPSSPAPAMSLRS
jgi:RNA-directed DNA polymerase